MNTTILLVRHADVHNPKQVVYGRLPRFRLSDDGRAQAEATAQWLAREPVSAFYSSPMLRARQTTRVLAQRHPGAVVRYTSALSEVRSSWEGTRWADMDANANLYEPLAHPDDESIEDIAVRMERFLRRLMRRHQGQTVVCVSHGDPIVIARVRLEGRELNLASIRQPGYPERASVTRLRFQGGNLVGTDYVSPAQALIRPQPS